MPILTLRLPDVKLSPTARPTACPRCGWKRLMRWGTHTKHVRDPRLHQVTVSRYIEADVVLTQIADIN